MTNKHERLARLDAEMMPRGSQRFQYLCAVRNGKRWIVCCMKIADFRFAATVSTGRKVKNIVLRTYERTPSAAVRAVLKQLDWNLKQSPEVFTKMFPQMEAVRAFQTRNRDELQKLREKTIADIKALKRKPGYVQAQFSNALEARLGRIDSLLLSV